MPLFFAIKTNCKLTSLVRAAHHRILFCAEHRRTTTRSRAPTAVGVKFEVLFQHKSLVFVERFVMNTPPNFVPRDHAFALGLRALEVLGTSVGDLRLEIHAHTLDTEEMFALVQYHRLADFERAVTNFALQITASSVSFGCVKEIVLFQFQPTTVFNFVLEHQPHVFGVDIGTHLPLFE